MKIRLCCAVMCLFISAAANAGIMVFPKYIFLDEKHKSDNVFLVNSDDKEAAKFRFSLKDYKQNPDGSVTAGDVKKNPLNAALRFSPRRSDLAPQKQQTIKLLVKDFSKLPVGDSVIYFAIAKVPAPQEVDSQTLDIKGVNIKLTPIHEVALPVVVRKGEVNDKGYLSDIKLKGNDITLRLYRVAGSSLPNGVVRGDISVWYKEELLGFVKGKYLLPQTQYADVSISLKDLQKLNSGKKDIKPELKILFTEYEDGNSINTKRIFDEKRTKL